MGTAVANRVLLWFVSINVRPWGWKVGLYGGMPQKVTLSIVTSFHEGLKQLRPSQTESNPEFQHGALLLRKKLSP
jgi:hypothetical protein